MSYKKRDKFDWEDEKMTLQEGYRLQEFEIKKVLGKGGFGVTYLAIDTYLDKEVAIKEFFPRDFVTRDEGDYSVSLQKMEEEYDEEKKRIYKRRYKHFLKRFEQEAKIMSSIVHPNVVKVIRYFPTNNTGYFVMNYIKGESLKKYIQKIGRLSQEQIMEVIIPTLEGVKAVHSKNFLHRDIAPDNIFLTQNGKPMILDFGSAKSTIIEDDGKEFSIGVIKKGYSAPEQYSDDSIHNVATDIYSVGAVIVFMMTGKMPPEATTRLTFLSTNKKDPLEELLEKYGAGYTQGFIKAILRAMSLNSEDRFQEISEFQKALITKRISLKRYILKNSKKLHQKEIIEIINSLFDKLEVIHTNKKTHSNLSPENVYLKENNVVELGRAMEVLGNSSKSLTVIRNIGYSPPEQYSMDSNDTKVTDLYSVGAIMLFMISGSIPTESTKRQTDIFNNKEDCIKKILDGYRDRYSDEFLKVILKAMKLNPKERFQDIILFREALNSHVEEPPSPTSRFSIKNIALVGVILLGLGGVVYYSQNKSTYKIPVHFVKELNNQKIEIKREIALLKDKKTFIDNIKVITLNKCLSEECVLGQLDKLKQISLQVKSTLNLEKKGKKIEQKNNLTTKKSESPPLEDTETTKEAEMLKALQKFNVD